MCLWDPEVYYFNVLLVDPLERKLSKMPKITECSFKLTEKWLIDKVIKGQSLKSNFYAILASGKIVLGPQKTPVDCYVIYDQGPAGLNDPGDYDLDLSGQVVKYPK